MDCRNHIPDNSCLGFYTCWPSTFSLLSGGALSRNEQRISLQPYRSEPAPETKVISKPTWFLTWYCQGIYLPSSALFYSHLTPFQRQKSAGHNVWIQIQIHLRTQKGGGRPRRTNCQVPLICFDQPYSLDVSLLVPTQHYFKIILLYFISISHHFWYNCMGVLHFTASQKTDSYPEDSTVHWNSYKFNCTHKQKTESTHSL